VILFKRSIDDFKNAAREKKFTVRDFRYDSEAIAQGKEEKKKLLSQKEVQKNKLVIWCKTNFAEADVAYIHLKAVRVFVESILRFGLPVSFQGLLIQPHKKDDSKTRKLLNDSFKYLNSKHLDEDEGDGSEAFYPYVSFNINIEFKN